MNTAIVQAGDAAIIGAHDQNVVAAERCTQEIAGLGYLTFMTDVYPRPLEDPRHLQVEDIGIGINPLMNPPWSHQSADFFGAKESHVD